MSEYTWMPFFVADYLADTGHLTTLQHGAYLLLIMHYWQTGGLPRDDQQLALIARMTGKQWQANRDVLARLFSRKWTHKRIDAERERAEKKRKNSQNAARERHYKNKDLRKTASRSHTSRATLTPHHIESSLRSDSGESAASPHCARAEIPEPELPFPKPESRPKAKPKPADFVPDIAYAEGKGLSRQDALREAEQFRNYHDAKGSLFKNWPAAWRTWVGNAVRFAANRQATGPPTPASDMKAAFDELLGRNRHEQAASEPPTIDASVNRTDPAGARDPVFRHAIPARR